MRMGPIGCPETSVSNYYSLCNEPEERGSRLIRCGSLKSHKNSQDLKLWVFGRQITDIGSTRSVPKY
jgi:hypothetical protein